MSTQWVLIRGIMSEAFHWWDFLPLLKKYFPEDHFHTPTILGNGESFHLSTPVSISKNVHGLRQQVDRDGKKILVGFSLGGMLALEWAHAHPEEVDSVILINCSLNNSPLRKRLTPFALKEIISSSKIKDLVQREEAILRMTTYLPEEKIKRISPAWGERSALLPVKPMNFIWQLCIAAQAKQRQAPPAPTLVLCSGKDLVVHPDCSAKIAATWNLPLIQHPEAGHDLTLEDPYWVIEQISNWKLKFRIAPTKNQERAPTRSPVDAPIEL